MKNSAKKILAFLLCFELLLSMACNAIPVVYATETDGTTEVTCDCPMTDGLHNGTCPYYTCPNCGLVGWAHFPEDCPALEESGEEESTACTVCGNEVCTCETVEEETKEETEEEDPGEEETTVCEVCGNEPCTCETAEEETTPDYSGDIDKNATFNPNGYESVIVMDTEPNEDWETASMEFYVSEFSGDILFGIDAYKVVATDYHTYDDNGNIIDTETVQSLWYQVSVLGGTTPADFANGYWIFQNYLGDNAEEYDVLILSAPEENVCEICGETDCTAEHVWCDTCGKYDCGLTHEVCEICGKENCSTQHTYCGVCGGLDCTTEHVYCSICKDFDCGIEHETEPEEEIDNKPITAPVIPETPSLPDEYDVAIVTDSGALVTEAGGFRLSAGYKASLSAWSALGEDVSYQWQVRYDAENDLWADITGQTGKGLLFSHAMFAGVQDDAGRAYVRCVTSVDGETLTSEPVCITIDYTDYEAASASAEVAAAAFSLRTASEAFVTYTDGGISLLADGDNYVTVTINYWDENSFGKDVKTPVYEPYIANILKGSPFNTPVTSPTYLGYAAYYDKDGDGTLEDSEDATYFNPDLGAVDEDITFDLYYQPIEVPVAIRYFFQNINDDDYTENTSYYYPTMLKTGTIVSDAYLEACLAEKATALGKLDTLAGFSKMHHEPEAVAADGSTVFECYYDRNYFMIAFKLGEGAYGVEPIYARYETPVLVNAPINPGHAFHGWNLIAVDADADNTFETTYGDTNIDVLPSTLPAENRKYEALWTEADTSYTIVYWLKENTGNSYLGSATTPGMTGKIATSTLYKCGLAEHAHSDACIGCGLEEHNHTTAGCARSDTLICGKTEHTHGAADCSCTVTVHTHGDGKCTYKCGKTETHSANVAHSVTCYTQTTLVTAASQTDNTVKNAYNGLRNRATNPSSGYVYKYAYRSGGATRYYNFFYFNDTWYYLGTNTDYDNITPSGTLSDPNRNNYNHVAATTSCHSHVTACYSCTEHTHGDGTCLCSKEEHTHIDSCYAYACGLVEHTHDDSCNTCGLTEHTHVAGCASDLPFDASRMEFVSAEENVVIEGDGSTILNVYYKYKDYTLRFYYARSSGSGTNAIYQVPGGSTYPFGKYGSNTEDTTVAQLLANVGDWGTVTGLNGTKTDFNEKGQGRIKETADDDEHPYTLGSYEANGYSYHYLEFTAPYNSNLKDLWPVDIFNSVTSATHTHSINTGSYQGDNKVSVTCDGMAYFSAWNGEFKVKYTQKNANQTIKGLYLYLDDNLLFDTSQFDDGTPVSYLCFWENGANVGWSFPELYEYRLWVKPTSEPEADDKFYTSETYTSYTDTYHSEYDGYVLYDAFSVYDDSSPEGQTDTYIRGYDEPVQVDKILDSNSADGSMEHYIINYFYNCDGYTLELHNINTSETVGTDIEYGTPLSDIFISHGYDAADNYAPAYPVGSLEEGGYEFEGWYPSEDCIPSTKIDPSTATMPYNDLILYANWEPKTHTVQFFYNLTDLNNYVGGDTSVERHDTRYITHGKTVGESDPEHPLVHPENDHDDTTEDEHMSFVRWFYLENGKKVAFSPDDTLIKKDLNVYAEWRDKRIQSFRISYKLLSDKTTAVADDESGYAYMSTTRTFTAKAGDPDNELYDTYRSGYFPITASHSMIMQFEPDLDTPVHNLFTFYYTTATSVTYKVRHVNSVTGAVMDETGAIDANGNNVVTARYKAFDGFTPDAFYKRLVLSVKETYPGSNVYVGDDDANIITFYYTPSTTAARYVIHYMTETLDGGVYETDHMVEGIGTVGVPVTITPTSLAGFELLADAAKYYVNGIEQNSGLAYSGGEYSFVVTKEGSELYLYYERLDYDYAVHYYEYNTTKSLKASISGYAPYGSEVTETAPDIENYTCVSAQTTRTITIREEAQEHGALTDPTVNVKQNNIIFYYMPKQYVVDYIPVPTAGGKIFPSTRETLSGNAAVVGVTLSANPLYRFDGWFTDKECQNEVAEEVYEVYDKTTGAFKPKKSALSDMEVNSFYAKFTLLAADFTIIRENGSANQAYIYKVQSKTDPSFVIYVPIEGNGSKTITKLPLGEYTVTQETNWSWRFTRDQVLEVNHNGSAGSNSVVFSGGIGIFSWLTGSSLRSPTGE